MNSLSTSSYQETHAGSSIVGSRFSNQASGSTAPKVSSVLSKLGSNFVRGLSSMPPNHGWNFVISMGVPPGAEQSWGGCERIFPSLKHLPPIKSSLKLQYHRLLQKEPQSSFSRVGCKCLVTFSPKELLSRRPNEQSEDSLHITPIPCSSKVH